mgnify:FL=1
MSDNSFMFGVLPSEFSAPATLSEDFKDFEATVSQLVTAYQYGVIEPAAAAAALSEMIVIDHNGMQWTLGATTMRWYRRIPGGDWRNATPSANDSGESVKETVRAAKAVATQAISDAQASTAGAESAAAAAVESTVDTTPGSGEDVNKFF